MKRKKIKMDILDGMKYNIKGVDLALKTPKLLMLGIFRFVFVLFLVFFLSGLIFYWHDEILTAIWKKPESGLLIYLWFAISYLLSIVLFVISMVVAYLISQLLFCVFIMDYMSRITESIILGKQIQPSQMTRLSFFFHLVKQEIPRAILPVIITLFIMIIGLFTPLGPIIILISSITAAVFLAWDNTDLVPARRMYSFKIRIGFLKKNLMFHIGFGLLFLIPGLNIVFLSFAPVGATLSFIEREGL